MDTTPSLSQTSLYICSRFDNQKQHNFNQKKKNTQQERHAWKPMLQHWTQQKKMRKKQTKEKKLKTLEMNKSTKSTSVNTQRFSKLTVKATRRGHSAAKLSDKEFNALPWNGMERCLQTQSIEPKIDNLWNELFAEGTSTPLQTLMIRVNENKATTPVNKKLTKKQFFDELSLQSGALDAAGTYALDISDRLEGHVEELRNMKSHKGSNIPVNVIEKVSSMVEQVKDLQQKIDEANNNICRLKNQFMRKTKQTENSNKKTKKKKFTPITPKKSKKRKIRNEIE
jgi:hypothetical protein